MTDDNGPEREGGVMAPRLLWLLVGMVVTLALVVFTVVVGVLQNRIDVTAISVALVGFLSLIAKLLWDEKDGAS